MVHTVALLLACSLVAVIYQDFKSREVSIISFLGVFFSLLILSYPGNAEYWVVCSSINIVLVTVQLLVSFVAISVRRRRVTNIVNEAIGLGDIVMLEIYALGFSTIFFILITLLASLVSLLLFLTGRVFRWERSTIPLAGVMALVLLLALGLKYGGAIGNLYDGDCWRLMDFFRNV